ncbi:Fungal specific transcription factor domain, partial [Teratosphaeria destructans]
PPPPPPVSTAGLDTLAEGSRYHHQQQLQHQQAMHELNGAKPQPSSHRRSYSNKSADDGSDAQGRRGMRKGRNGSSAQTVGAAIRRRISRACDQCNQLRTKCDGRHPCAHCVEFGLSCEYARERKKRGKASRKDIAAQQAVAQAASSNGKEPSPKSAGDEGSDEHTDGAVKQPKGVKRRRSSEELPPPQLPHPALRPQVQNVARGSNGNLPNFQQGGSVTALPMGAPSHANHQQRPPVDQNSQGVGIPTPRLPSVGLSERGMSVGMVDDYHRSIDDYHRSILHPGATVSGHNILHSGIAGIPNSMIQGGAVTGYNDGPYAVASPSSQPGGTGAPFRTAESPLSAGFLGQSPMAGSPGWLSLPSLTSPTAALYPHMQPTTNNQILRYPVLRPILPHVSAVIPLSLACDLLELYFSSTSSTFTQPRSPYILGYCLRKKSFLRQHNPRQCSPALLASMLWIGAQTSESSFLTSAPSARGKICQKLLELTIGLLKPLIHAPNERPSGFGSNTVINGVALGGLGAALPHQTSGMEDGCPGAAGSLDDIATYIHLATVVSASEYKAASLRWWNAAMSLARELKLGRELPPNPEPPQNDGQDGEMGASGEQINGHRPAHAHVEGHAPGAVSEEEREERRRVWWLLYIVDRHLALCYNKPLFLLDIECDGLLQPENDLVWQAGEYYPAESHTENSYFRRRGPGFECTGHSMFGYFLPLMTILGEIVDLNHAKNHPRFGSRSRCGIDWNDQAAEIVQQLEAYGRSLNNFEARTSGLTQEPKHAGEAALNRHKPNHDVTSPQSVGTNHSGPRITETVLQTKIVVAYGTHLMHTLHILLNGKWDPISLLDDNDLWISSQSFISATGHAVSAAEAINDILDYDPDLSFMPFFFGIYLLQGSFLLLLIADKLQGEASPSVVKACETIVRAHEACVVTLNTEYQRNFRKVMRSALAQVRGRSLEDPAEQQLKRREVLALYRWSGDGTGLAL